MMDLHGAPGSQNGNDHSGQSGSIGFYYSDDHICRAAEAVRRIAEWASSLQWRDTVTIIQLLNEPVLWSNYNYRLQRLKQYYRICYDAIRSVNANVVVAIHDAFISYDNWYYFLDDPHYRWVMLDVHLYQVFGDEWKELSCEQHEKVACRHRDALKKANDKLWTMMGEWSLATPKSCGNKGNIARQQIGIWEEFATGWFFWSHKITDRAGRTGVSSRVWTMAGLNQGTVMLPIAKRISNQHKISQIKLKHFNVDLNVKTAVQSKLIIQ